MRNKYSIREQYEALRLLRMNPKDHAALNHAPMCRVASLSSHHPPSMVCRRGTCPWLENLLQKELKAKSRRFKNTEEYTAAASSSQLIDCRLFWHLREAIIKWIGLGDRATSRVARGKYDLLV